MEKNNNKEGQSAFTEEEILEELSRISDLMANEREQDSVSKRKIYDRKGTNEEKEYGKIKGNYNNIRDWMY